MFAVTLSQPWATLVAEGRKRVILIDEDPGPYRMLSHAEIAIHAGDVWDGSAWGVICRMTRGSFVEQYRSSPAVTYPMNAVICRCADVSFRDHYDDLCVGGALEPIRGRPGLTIFGRVVKVDPVACVGGDGLWQWDEGTATVRDASGQVLLF